jgi:septal ring-binding cell division protein DamX
MPEIASPDAAAPAQQSIAQPAGVSPTAPVPAGPAAIAAAEEVAVPAATKAIAAAAARTTPSAQTAAARTTGAAPGVAMALGAPDVPGTSRPGSADHVPPPPPTGNLARARFAATQEWLKNAPGDQYSIQLVTADTHDVRRIEELLARAAGRNLELSEFYVYGVKIDDRQHYRLAYGLYPTLAAVTQGIKDLPPVYAQFGPYYRSVDRMRSQNHQ